MKITTVKIDQVTVQIIL